MDTVGGNEQELGSESLGTEIHLGTRSKGLLNERIGEEEPCRC